MYYIILHYYIYIIATHSRCGRIRHYGGHGTHGGCASTCCGTRRRSSTGSSPRRRPTRSAATTACPRGATTCRTTNGSACSFPSPGTWWTGASRDWWRPERPCRSRGTTPRWRLTATTSWCFRAPARRRPSRRITAT